MNYETIGMMIVEGDIDAPRQSNHAQRGPQSSGGNMTVVQTPRPAMNRINNDIRAMHSRFRSAKTLPLNNEKETFFNCCAFTPNQRYLMAAAEYGTITAFDMNSNFKKTMDMGEPFQHIKNMECHRSEKLLLTSSLFIIHYTVHSKAVLWDMQPFFDKKNPLQISSCFNKIDYAEFSKRHDKMIGTIFTEARVFDVATERFMKKFEDHSRPLKHRYQENKATFSINDELVLNDGILYDFKSGKQIHRFEMSNQDLSGVFHPNEREIISGSEIWDLRTFQRLKIIPSLEKMVVKFSPINNIIYAHQLDGYEGSDMKQFTTLDPSNYETIAIRKVEWDIHFLACNDSETKIAVVENQCRDYCIHNSCVRIYEGGSN